MDITVSISNQTFQTIKQETGIKLSKKEEKTVKAEIKMVLEGFYGQSLIRDAIVVFERERAYNRKK